MTIRTKSNFEAIYLTPTGTWPDNTTQEISPEDLRNGVKDLFESQNSYWNLDYLRDNGYLLVYNSISGIFIPTDTINTSGNLKIGDYINGNYTEFQENTGNIRSYGSGMCWDDLRIPGEQVKTNASSPDLIDFINSSLQCYGFNGQSTLEQVYFSLQIPHDSVLNPELHPHIHWTPTTNDSGNVKWFLDYSWADVGETFLSPITLSGIGSTEGEWFHTKTNFPVISGHGSGTSSMLKCRLYRNPSDDQDTYNNDVAFLEIDFHYQRDSFGSRQEYVK